MTAHPSVRTTCPYCGVGCGIVATPDGRGGAAVIGDPEHPANAGRLCSKGAALGETLSLDGRLLHPMLRGADGTLARTTWDDALDRVAAGFRRVIDRHGPDAVAFYLSGQLLTEDYYVANKLMKGFLGSANVDTNSRLCMSSSVAGHRRSFGADVVPGVYADLDEADLIVLVGSNAAWCHPVLYQRMMAARRRRGTKIVVVDPRRTATAEDADLVLTIAPGMDTVLFSGLLVHLADTGAIDRTYMDAHTSGFDEALRRARSIAPDIAATAATAGLSASDVAHFFDLFAATGRTVTAFSQGVNQSAQGTDKVSAIVNCHLATGRIGRPGMGPFSLTGQPNAMGGREVGGLANQLAAHMGFSQADIDRVGRFWGTPAMAGAEGLKAVDMFAAVERGDIKALWVMATNPAVSLPRAGAVRQALGRLDLLVVSENVLANDTVTAGAHVLLPAAAWGEKDGTVTNSERRISRQRAFLPAPGEAKPDWWMVAQVARRLGFADAFAYGGAADIFREHAALSGFENDGMRAFDIGALADISDPDYDALQPTQWPARAPSPLPACGERSERSAERDDPGEGASPHMRRQEGPSPRPSPRKRGEGEDKRFFATGGFVTPDRRARFIAVAPPALRSPTDDAFPFRLNTGRVRDQWHTMTRTGKSPRLGHHLPEPFVEIHPDDAASAGVTHGGFARVVTAHGACVLKVAVKDGQRQGSLFAPIHWSDETASSARIGELVMEATDPFSGQPEAKATPAAIAPAILPWAGFALSRTPLAFPSGTWWARVAVAGGVGYLFATAAEPGQWAEIARKMFADRERAEYVDHGLFRLAAFTGHRLDGALFVGRADDTPQWDAVRTLFENETVAVADRRVVLSARRAGGRDAGALVCACFGVGVTAIRDAVAAGACDVAAIGAALRAGTNCGSCLPELKRIVARELKAAE
jgi:assimilatory nitrate reductase catalytic subunit